MPFVLIVLVAVSVGAHLTGPVPRPKLQRRPAAVTVHPSPVDRVRWAG
jgi:hypothetical protein